MILLFVSKISQEKLPLVNLNGSPEEIGKQHGKLLKNRVINVLEFYKTQFRGASNRPDEEIFKLAEECKLEINNMNQDYSVEIEAIANAADIDPLWIYALNARSEIMNKFHLDDKVDVNECTSLYFKETSLIGQNWDWASELENFVVLTKIKQESNKPDILMMTEPGIIGKIGLNSAGLGVLLNFLHIDGFDPYSVPTHILLRATLDSKTLEEAKETLLKYSKGRTSNIMVGDSSGNYFDIEYAGDEYFMFESGFDSFVHTNHYLGKTINTDPVEYASSFSRYKRGQELLSNLPNQSLESMKKILLDKENSDLPICRVYKPSVSGFLNDTGTICSIIMDLEKKNMHITRGNPFENPFSEIKLN